MPDVVILVETVIQEDAIEARELVAAPEDDGQRVFLVLGQLQAEDFDLGLHFIGNVAQRLTPDTRAHAPLPCTCGTRRPSCIFLEALGWRNFCEVPLALGALAKYYGAIADDQQNPLWATAKLWLETLQALVADLGQPSQAAMASLCQG